jgi:hypothetical protein
MNYLGIMIRTSGDDTCAHVNLRIKKARNAFHAMRSKGLQSSGLSTASALTVLEKVIIPILWYGMEILILSKTHWDKIDKLVKRLAQNLLSIRPQASTTWVLWEANTLPAEFRWKKSTVTKWCKRECGATPAPRDMTFSHWNKQIHKVASDIGAKVPNKPSKFSAKSTVMKAITEIRESRRMKWADDFKDNHFQTHPRKLMSGREIPAKISTLSLVPQGKTILNARAHTLGFPADRVGVFIKKSRKTGLNCKDPGCSDGHVDSLGHAMFECQAPYIVSLRNKWEKELSQEVTTDIVTWLKEGNSSVQNKVALILSLREDDWFPLAITTGKFIKAICDHREFRVYRASRQARKKS